MTLDALTAVSPIDGRYRSKTESLADYFSELRTYPLSCSRRNLE